MLHVFCNNLVYFGLNVVIGQYWTHISIVINVNLIYLFTQRFVLFLSHKVKHLLARFVVAFQSVNTVD